MRSHQNRLHDEDGMTLVDVVVGIFIIGVIFTAFAAFMLTTLQTVSASEYRTHAVQLATQELDLLQTTEWSTLTGWKNGTTEPPDQYLLLEEKTECAVEAISPSCALVTTVISSEREDDRVLRLAVTVEWEDHGKTESVNMQSLAADPDPSP